MNEISLNNILKSRLFKNMSWLFILNFANTLIPYFTFPYITRVLLPQGYGMISFALSFIAYFQTFIDYGFNLTGVRKIAEEENNPAELSKIYTTILSTKFLFFIISIPIILISIKLNSSLYEARKIIYIFIFIALSNVLMPTWLFQGLQKVKYMTIISLSIRTLFLISVFTLVKSPSDVVLYCVLYSASFVIIGVISLIFIRNNMKIRFSKTNLSLIKDMVIDGFYVFTSSAIISVIGTTGVFVLGLFSSSEIVGYYAGIQKINQVITMAFYPIGQALFPYISNKYSISFKSGYNVIIKISKLLIPIFMLVTMIIIFLRKPIVNIVLGKSYIEHSNILIILSFGPLFSIISNFLGTQILVASGHVKEYSRAFLKCVGIYVGLYFVLGYMFSMWGVASARIIGDIASLLFLYFEVRKIEKD